VTGHAVLGQVARTSEGEPAPSLLGGGHDHPKFIMIFSEDGQSAEVMEEVSTKFSRIFSLTRSEKPVLPGAQVLLSGTEMDS
jgi:hypothetical protein